MKKRSNSVWTRLCTTLRCHGLAVASHLAASDLVALKLLCKSGPKAEPGAQPQNIFSTSGVAEPRLTSGGEAAARMSNSQLCGFAALVRQHTRRELRTLRCGCAARGEAGLMPCRQLYSF
jgi:hypothetical protein